MTKQPTLRIWFIATATTFLGRAFLYSVWVSRGPEIKDALGLDTASMGLLVMLYPLGGLVGVLFADRLQKRFGSRITIAAAFSISAASMIGLGFAIPAANLALTSVLLFLMGLPMSITDFVQNYEASAINAKSPRSLISAIHSAFGVGLMLGALASNIFISAGISLQLGFFITSVIVFLPSAWAATVFPKNETTSVPATISSDSATKFSPWREVRTLKIAFIGLTFIVAEVSAATWVPIALVQSGVSASDAAVALSIFWLVVTIARATGGLLVDRVGRANTLLIASLTTATGTAIFGLSPLINLPYLGMLPWAAGMALGFPMAVNAMADDPARAAKRINMMITVVYISGLIVGPLLGGVGQQVGIFLAFSLPTAFLVIGAALSKNARQLQS